MAIVFVCVCVYARAYTNPSAHSMLSPNYLSAVHTRVTHLEQGSMEECESCQQCAFLFQ